MKNNKHEKFLSLRSVFHLCLRHFTFAILATVVLSGCGSGGGGGGGSSASGASVLSGTAAAGAPLANGTVTLKDSTGATATTTADANGNYSFDVSAKRFPLMLKVQPGISGAAPLFSAALTSGTANTTPLTALQVFEAVGRTDPSAIYNSGDFSKIRNSTLDFGKLTVASNLASQLTFNGLDPTTVDPIGTPLVANGVGMDALMDHTNVAIIGNDAILADSAGNCIPYGPPNVMTLAIDGMDLTFLWDSGAGMGDQYVKKALNTVCVSGIDQPRPLAPNFTNPSVMWSNVTWTRILPILVPDVTDTNNGVTQLITQLKDANARNKLAKQRGGIAGPINIVAHSWGTVIAYIALTELAGDDKYVTDPTVPDPTIEVNLITMGSPIECLTGDLVCIKSLLIQQSVPPEFRGQPIRVPSNVITWTNYVNAADPVASNISALPNVTNVKIDNEPVADCPPPPSGSMAGSTPVVASSCTSHSVYFDVGGGSVAPTLFLIRSLIAHSSVEQTSASTTIVSPPSSTTPAPPPSAFSLTAGAPYCDTNTPVGPAVKLTWNASDSAVFYRVFRDGSGVGVNLTASQLSFLNNLGLVAGQTYSYKVQAVNANGTTWSDVVPVTIPAAVCVSAADPKIIVGPATLNFGNVAVGSCGTATVAVQHVTGTNPASGTVSVGPNPPFSITSGGSFSVSNGSAANVSIQFCPSSPLTYTGTATVTSSAAFTGANTVALSGTGTSTTTTSLSFTALTPTSVSTSAALYQPTLTASGTNFNNVNKVTFSLSGATSGIYTWVKGDANWNAKVVVNSDGSMTLAPVVTQTGDPAGLTTWTVTLTDSTNTSLSRTFTVNYTPPSTTPDLQVLNGSSVSSSGVVTASWTLANQGAGTANASTTVVRINQSSTNAAGSNLASISTPSLAAGGSTPQNATVSAPTTAGTYYVWVLADNYSTSGQSTSAAANDIVQIGSFTVGTPPAAPSVTSISPTTMTANGVSQTLSIYGSNFQNGNLVQFKWGVGAGAGVWNNATGAMSVLSAGQINVSMNPGTVSDMIYVRVCRSASQTAAADCSTGTQAVTVTAVVTTPPDLVTQNLTVSPTSGAAGSTATVSFTIRNQGSGTAVASTTNVRINTSTSNVTTSDPLLASINVPSLAAGATYLVSQPVTIPAGRPSGTNYIWVILDANSTAGQGSVNEANDRSYASYTVSVSPSKEVTVANLSGGLLMLRFGPGLSYSIITTLPEGTKMGVIGGPTLADGFTWWNISGTSGAGWSAIGEWLTPQPLIGATVTVSYTGGAGLRLRSTASLSGTILTTLPEGTQVNVFSGPILANGYTWWAVQGYVGGTQYTGWSAVGDWLTPNPRY